MKYKIKYTYSTGDSYTSFLGIEDFLELEWENIDVVKSNLNRIREHYKMYQDLEEDKNILKILEENKNKDWFVKELKWYSCKKDSEDEYLDRFVIDHTEKQRKSLEKKGYKVYKDIDTTLAQYQLIIYTDDNKPYRFWAPWCGFFSSLGEVEIVLGNFK